MKTRPHTKSGGFPAFMKRRQNRVSPAGLPPGLKGWLYEARDGTQVCLWECVRGGFSKMHTHPYDEYAVVLSGWFKGTIGGRKVSMKRGDECHIPAGVSHDGEYSAGYRAIDAFGGPRVKRALDV
ncbi:MAG: cupin domain-containing protein [Lentisphaerae bacterium]|nr:cupin domain-containing protein [Lentisphaerota bacterium]